MTGRRGLTLVELSVALAISALLAAAALRAAVTLARVEAAERRSVAATESHAPLRRLVTADLIHAKRRRLTKAGLELESWMMLDESTLTVKHLPGQVTYAVETIGGTPWLVRLQRQNGGTGDSRGAKGFGEPVCPGVARVALETTAAAPARIDPDGWREMPATATVIVEFTDSARPALRFDVHRK